MLLIVWLSVFWFLVMALVEALTVPEACENKHFGYKIQDPQDCHSFYVCLEHWGQYKLECYLDYHFNEMKQKCIKGMCPPNPCHNPVADSRGEKRAVLSSALNESAKIQPMIVNINNDNVNESYLKAFNKNLEAKSYIKSREKNPTTLEPSNNFPHIEREKNTQSNSILSDESAINIYNTQPNVSLSNVFKVNNNTKKLWGRATNFEGFNISAISELFSRILGLNSTILPQMEFTTSDSNISESANANKIQSASNIKIETPYKSFQISINSDLKKNVELTTESASQRPTQEALPVQSTKTTNEYNMKVAAQQQIAGSTLKAGTDTKTISEPIETTYDGIPKLPIKFAKLIALESTTKAKTQHVTRTVPTPVDAMPFSASRTKPTNSPAESSRQAVEESYSQAATESTTLSAKQKSEAITETAATNESTTIGITTDTTESQMDTSPKILVENPSTFSIESTTQTVTEYITQTTESSIQKTTETIRWLPVQSTIQTQTTYEPLTELPIESSTLPIANIQTETSISTTTEMITMPTTETVSELPIPFTTTFFPIMSTIELTTYATISALQTSTETMTTSELITETTTKIPAESTTQTQNTTEATIDTTTKLSREPATLTTELPIDSSPQPAITTQTESPIQTTTKMMTLPTEATSLLTIAPSTFLLTESAIETTIDLTVQTTTESITSSLIEITTEPMTTSHDLITKTPRIPTELSTEITATINTELPIKTTTSFVTESTLEVTTELNTHKPTTQNPATNIQTTTELKTDAATLSATQDSSEATTNAPITTTQNIMPAPTQSTTETTKPTISEITTTCRLTTETQVATTEHDQIKTTITPTTISLTTTKLCPEKLTTTTLCKTSTKITTTCKTITMINIRTTKRTACGTPFTKATTTCKIKTTTSSTTACRPSITTVTNKPVACSKQQTTLANNNGKTIESDNDFADSKCTNYDGIHFIKHPQQCNKYYTCYKKQAYSQVCPGNFLFDEKQQMCNYPDAVNCKVEVQKQLDKPKHDHKTLNLKPADCSSIKTGTFIRDSSNCNKYYVCLNGRAVALYCPRGQYFDIEGYVCNFKALVKNCCL